MLRRSSRGSFSATGGSSSMSASSASYSSSSASASKVMESSSSSRSVTSSSTVVGGSSQMVSGGQSVTRQVESTRVIGGGSVGASRSTMVVSGSSSSAHHDELTYEQDVAQARLRLKPITAARASVMFGRAASASGGSAGGAMVAYGAHAAGGSDMMAMTTRSHSSMEARQLAMHLEGIIDERQKNKSELWQLNERLAEYVEKTRFLEAQNRRLIAEADILKAGFSTESVTLKARYQVEIDEAKRLIEESESRRVELHSRTSVISEQHDVLCTELETIESHNVTNLSVKERLITQLGELEGDLATLRRRVGDFDFERNRYRGTIQRLREEEADLRRDLDQERMVSMMAKSTASQLQDELTFVLEAQTSKTTEMASLAYRDTTEENRALWKSEFSEAFRKLHSDYMTRMEEAHSEADAVFQMQVRQEQSTTTKDSVEMRHFSQETHRFKDQVDRLTMRSTELTTRIAQFEVQLTELHSEKVRIQEEHVTLKERLTSELHTYQQELTSTRHEVQTILDDKLSLEIEIASYRTLLDAEEVRIKEDIQAVIEDQRHVKELMASRGIYEGALAIEGHGHGGGGYGAMSSMSSFKSGSYRSGGGGGAFGSGMMMGGGGSSSSSSYYSSSYSAGGRSMGGFL